MAALEELDPSQLFDNFDQRIRVIQPSCTSPCMPIPKVVVNLQARFELLAQKPQKPIINFGSDKVHTATIANKENINPNLYQREELNPNKKNSTRQLLRRKDAPVPSPKPHVELCSNNRLLGTLTSNLHGNHSSALSLAPAHQNLFNTTKGSSLDKPSSKLVPPHYTHRPATANCFILRKLIKDTAASRCSSNNNSRDGLRVHAGSGLNNSRGSKIGMFNHNTSVDNVKYKPPRNDKPLTSKLSSKLSGLFSLSRDQESSNRHRLNFSTLASAVFNQREEKSTSAAQKSSLFRHNTNQSIIPVEPSVHSSSQPDCRVNTAPSPTYLHQFKQRYLKPGNQKSYSSLLQPTNTEIMAPVSTLHGRVDPLHSDNPSDFVFITEDNLVCMDRHPPSSLLNRQDKYREISNMYNKFRRMLEEDRPISTLRQR